MGQTERGHHILQDSERHMSVYVYQLGKSRDGDPTKSLLDVCMSTGLAFCPCCSSNCYVTQSFPSVDGDHGLGLGEHLVCATRMRV